MKILIVNTLYSPYKIGGAEVSVQLLSESLAKQGHLVRVVCLHPDKERKLSLINDVEVVYLPLLNLYWPFDNVKYPAWKRFAWHLLDSYNLFMSASIGHELDNFKPDVVHTNNLAGFSVGVWREVKKRNIRLVHTTRDYYLFHPNATLFQCGLNMPLSCMSVRIWSWLKRLASKQVDAVVGISQFISDLHKQEKFFPNSSRTYIYNPVKQPKTKNIPSNTPRIGFIGRLTEEKGFDSFCDIISKISNLPERYEFIAAGRFNNGTDGKKLAERAEELNINLLGFASLETFLSQVDMVILPIKWREPFGRTVVECALTGKPVFTNRTGGIDELFSMFDNLYDVKSITSSLEMISSGKSMLDNCKKSSYPDIFSIEKVAAQYLHIYK